VATLTITIPDGVAVRVRDGYCYQNGYTDTIRVLQDGVWVDVPNPETKAAYMKRMILLHIKHSVLLYEADAAAEAARSSAAEAVENDITLG
jgi:hypothetical protein